MQKVFFIDGDNTTGQKNVIFYQKFFEAKGYEFTAQLVTIFDEWKSAFLTAQKYDAVVLAINSVIKNWNDEKAKSFA